MTRVSLAPVAVAAFFAAVVLPRATLPMVDGDAWWHIHAGEEIIATGRVPGTNTWTIAGDGLAWTSQDWLSNVLMAWLFNAGAWGVGLLSLVFAMAAVAAFAFLWRALDARLPATGWLARLLWLTAGLIVAGPIVGIRVQTLDLPLAAATAWILWRYVAAPRAWLLPALPALAIAWVNLHAGWVMLFLLGGAVLVGEALDRWRGRRLEPEPPTPEALGWLAAALIAAAAALVVNPNGAAIYAYPFETAAISAHRDFLVEWSPPNLASFEGQVTVAFLVGGVAPTLVFGWRRLRTADLLWLVGLSLLAIMAVRFAIFLGPIGAAVAAASLAPRIGASRAGRAWRPILEQMAHPPGRRSLAAINGVLVAVVVLGGTTMAVARAAPATQEPQIARSVPIGAAAWLAENAPDARIFNTYSWGGYLARALPDAKAYIDGRSDIYGNEPIQRYAATLDVRTDPSVLLDEARIDVVLLAPWARLNAWLATSDGWDLAYEDDVSRLWRR